jgi:hypothetical protein
MMVSSWSFPAERDDGADDGASAFPEFSRNADGWLPRSPLIEVAAWEGERPRHTWLSAMARQNCLLSAYVHLIAEPVCRTSEHATAEVKRPDDGS